MARVAIAVRIDALFVEVHKHADQGKLNAANMISLEQLKNNSPFILNMGTLIKIEL